MSVRVLIVVGGLGHEGISNSVLNYLEHINPNKLDVHLGIAGIAEEDCIERIDKDKIQIHYLPGRNTKPIKYMIELSKLVRQEKFDIVHVHGNSATLAVDLLAAKVGGCKNRIAHSHNTMCVHKKADKILRGLFKKVCTECFACGELAGKWLFGEKRFQIIPNAVNTEKFNYSNSIREKSRVELGIGNEILIGHIGCFNNVKNHEFLIQIFADLLKEKKEAKLLLVGEGEKEEQIKQLVKMQGIEDAVIFYGVTDRVPELLMAMDVFVLPSLYEGLPCVLVEAQASGLPCVVSDTVSKEAKLTDLVEFISLDEPVQKWGELILERAHEDRGKACFNAQEKLIVQHYEIKSCVRYLEKLYLEIAQKKGK